MSTYYVPYSVLGGPGNTIVNQKVMVTISGNNDGTYGVIAVIKLLKADVGKL